MKLLVVCQYYYPEPFRITDICESLAKRGHEVTVLTGLPNYPEGKVLKAYKYGQKRKETCNGVKIIRTFEIGRGKGPFRRFLNYFSFAISGTVMAKRLKEDFDCVLVNQLSPVMMAWPGLAYKKKHHKKLVLYCLDLWPASLRAGGVSENSFLYKLFRRMSKGIYQKADSLLVSSRMFANYLSDEFGISRDRIAYLPQYAEDFFVNDACQTIKPKDTVDLVFAGNIGKAQSVQTVIRAAKVLEHIEKLRWHIVGDGSELANCKALAEALGRKSIIFYGRRPAEEMPKFYAMADAMLVTLADDPVLSMTLPGKVQSYMAAGKPIIGAANGETAAVIEEAGCGFCCEAENAEALAECVLEFLKEHGERLGSNAREYYEKNFTKSRYLDLVNTEMAGMLVGV